MKPLSLNFIQKVIFTICFLAVSSLLAVFLYMFLASLLFPGISTSGVHFLQGLQLVQSVFTFILPALVLGALFGGNAGRYLNLEKVPQPRYVLLTIACMIAAIPVMNLIIAWNESVTLPSWLNNVEQWMTAREAEAKAITDLLLDTHSVGGLLLNLLLIGVMAAIGEEFLFRGLIQRLLYEKSRNTHIAVWTTALLFSAIHLQFYGFIPRLFLGAFFGYLVVWTGNLWLSVIAHFFNNALSVIADYLMRNGHPEISGLEEIGTPAHAIMWSIVSLAISVGLLMRFYKISSKRKNAFNRTSSGEI